MSSTLTPKRGGEGEGGKRGRKEREGERGRREREERKGGERGEREERERGDLERWRTVFVCVCVLTTVLLSTLYFSVKANFAPFFNATFLVTTTGH